ncbi:TIGR03808 family TAT-translocated repetitive protein [Bradyrhizobium sp. WD16]|nr:TIGR03808 family TAT-translocated repetitive protein [Bradyrhizobium sp. WD16]
MATALNAADYGLTSGSADQTAHLQAAINAAQTQGLPLFIPKGTFPVTSVNITAPIEIYAVPGQAKITGFGRSPTINIVGSTDGDGDEDDRFGPVTIRDLSFDGASQTFPAGGLSAIIQAAWIDFINVLNCAISNSGGIGIYLYKCRGRIEGNQIFGSKKYAVLNHDASNVVFIDRNVVTYSSDNGICVVRSSAGSDQGVISNNQIGFTSALSGGSGENGNAILVVNANYVKVIDNMTYNSAFSGIRANASSNAVISGNQCYGSGESAIYVEAPAAGTSWVGGVISSNRVETCGVGIVAANSNNGGRWISITGNQVSNCTNNTITYPGGSYQTWGRAIYAEADCLVANNQVAAATDWGIYVFAVNYNGIFGAEKVLAQVENNNVRNCAGGIGFYQADTTHTRVLIGGNMISGYTTTSRYAAIVAATYNGVTNEITKVAGAPDLGNATTSGYSNVVLLPNWSFT